ncbi:MAG: eukaryotic-like serine/threonine-protein kinase [Solirubrobacteraceae bacterium]|nr:eukaryotic-like serine/threonine-protein kinase [Solirubrobacteraceae bacterium]
MPLASAIELPERYRVTRHIASGGMATVWEVEDLLLGRVVAVKVLGSNFAADPRARARFQREARTAARVSEHPHIATIFDTGEHGENTYIVMEYFSGGTVADRLRAAKDGGAAVPRETALRWLREAALALDAAHAADIVHRDVKPANLLIDANDRLAVGDFGIARLADDTQMTQTGQVLGTAAYLSPEQALGQPATAASDRYALAVVAYELLTGTRPFAGGPVTAQARQHVEDEPDKATEAAPELPAAIDAVLARGLAKDPRDRPRTAVGLVEELERALGTATAPTKRVDSTRAMPAVLPAAGAAGAAGAATPRRPAADAPAAVAAVADHSSHQRRKAAPWLPVGVAAAAIAAVVVAIALASGGDGGGDGERASTTTPKKSASSSTQKTPAADEPPPAASPPPAPPPAANTGASPAKLNDQGYALSQAGDNARAVPLLQRSVEGFRDQGDRQSRNYSFAVYNLGTALLATGRAAEAIPYLQERLDNFDDRDELVAATLAKAQAQVNGEPAGDAAKKPKKNRDKG